MDTLRLCFLLLLTANTILAHHHPSSGGSFRDGFKTFIKLFGSHEDSSSATSSRSSEESHECSGGEGSNSTEPSKPSEPCNPTEHCFCDDTFRPVCGNDGNLYDSLCKLNCAYRCNSTLDVAPCCKPEQIQVLCFNTTYTSCGSDGKIYQNTCILKHTAKCVEGLHQVPCCQLPQEPCPDTDEPVCDSDFGRHKNLCYFERARLRWPDLQERPCDPVCDLGNCDMSPCGDEDDPVCASDGITYKNACAFSCAQSNNCAQLVFRYSGVCTTCDCPCPAAYEPVCTLNDYRTYNSLEEFECDKNCHPSRSFYKNTECGLYDLY